LAGTAIPHEAAFNFLSQNCVERQPVYERPPVTFAAAISASRRSRWICIAHARIFSADGTSRQL
jgi:hypothetical protein